MGTDRVPQLPPGSTRPQEVRDGIEKPALFLALVRVPASPFPPLALLGPSRHTLILTLTSTENRLLQPGARLM